VNRRLFLFSLISGAAGTAYVAAQPPGEAVRVSFIGSVSESTAPRAVAAFWKHLRELGWVEGRNLISESRWADGRLERLPGLMTDVVARRVDLLVTYGTPAATAARNASHTVPIVVMAMGDPVGTGLVESLARPGGNLTGLSGAWDDAFAGKWLELLQETVPRLATVAVVGHPGSPLTAKILEAINALGRERGLRIHGIGVKAADDIAPAIEEARRHAQAMLVLSDPVTFTTRRQLISLLAKYRLPTVFPMREFVDDGGLMSYGSDSADLGRRAAEYADKVLRGAKPGDLPIEQPTRFVLVVNLRTARELRLQLPESILLRADEIIR
jgi:putative tryptophan/tyrosine transport system substrate-binding protein